MIYLFLVELKRIVVLFGLDMLHHLLGLSLENRRWLVEDILEHLSRFAVLDLLSASNTLENRFHVLLVNSLLLFARQHFVSVHVVFHANYRIIISFPSVV